MTTDAATIVATTASTDEKEWITASVGPSGYRTEISAGPHRFLADEPVPLGGTGTGPTPYELLLGALASCMAMTLRMYADRKRWPLHGVRIHLRTDRAHEQDCEKCEDEEPARTFHVRTPFAARGHADAISTLGRGSEISATGRPPERDSRAPLMARSSKPCSAARFATSMASLNWERVIGAIALGAGFAIAGAEAFFTAGTGFEEGPIVTAGFFTTGRVRAMAKIASSRSLAACLSPACNAAWARCESIATRKRESSCRAPQQFA